MAGELKIKLPGDQKKINVNNLGEVIWWCNHFNVTPEKLLQLTEQIGNATEEIVKYLRKESLKINK